MDSSHASNSAELTADKLEPRTDALFDEGNFEAGKYYFEKVEQLSTQTLYVSVGVFAVLPVVLNTLRRPYRFSLLIWVIAFCGILAVTVSAYFKMRLLSYTRALAISKAGKTLQPNEKRIKPLYWNVFSLANLATLLEVIAFIVFVSLNVPTTLQEPPRIEGLQASQMVVEPGATVTVQANAIDRDSDILKYSWSATQGVLVDKDEPSVTWIAPTSITDDQQDFSIGVVVDDGQARAEKSLSIMVQESPEILVDIQRLCLLADSVENPGKFRGLASSPRKQSSQRMALAVSVMNVNLQAPPGADASASPTCSEISRFVKEGRSNVEKKYRFERVKSSLEKIKSIPAKLRSKLPCCDTGGGFLVPCKQC